MGVRMKRRQENKRGWGYRVGKLYIQIIIQGLQLTVSSALQILKGQRITHAQPIDSHSSPRGRRTSSQITAGVATEDVYLTRHSYSVSIGPNTSVTFLLSSPFFRSLYRGSPFSALELISGTYAQNITFSTPTVIFYLSWVILQSVVMGARNSRHSWFASNEYRTEMWPIPLRVQCYFALADQLQLHSKQCFW